MISVDLFVPPERVLAIGAHPDDVEFGGGATLAKWAAAGASVHLCVCTDGSKGSWDPATDTAELVALREDEQRDAAAALGIADVTFLRRVDGELVNDVGIQAALSAVIRRVRPDVVLGHDPWRPYRLHPDHRAAGEATIAAIVAARDPHFFPEQSDAPHRPSTLLLFEADRPDHVQAVDGFVPAKIAALLAHRSQWRSTMGIDAAPEAETERFAQRITDECATAGIRAGLRAGEAFRRIDAL